MQQKLKSTISKIWKKQNNREPLERALPKIDRHHPLVNYLERNKMNTVHPIKYFRHYVLCNSTQEKPRSDNYKNCRQNSIAASTNEPYKNYVIVISDSKCQEN